MSYLNTVSVLRQAANDVNPTGRFDHGRHVDISQGHEGNYPIIYVYPINVTKAVDPDFIDTNVVLIGFFKEDKPSTSNLERESIIGEMDTLSDEFIEVLSEMKLLKISNVTKEAQYQQYQGCVSGYAIRLTLQNFNPCP